jgi:hypothetical protein
MSRKQPALFELSDTASSWAEAPLLEAPPFPDFLPDALPDDPRAMRYFAKVFMEQFSNAIAPAAQAVHGPLYMVTLASMRSRGTSARTAWGAFCQAWLARDGKPLFRDLVKTALAFLPGKVPLTPPRMVESLVFDESTRDGADLLE